MGYNAVRLEVTARLSSHNDERDERDEQLWEKFRRQVQELSEDPEYQEIFPQVF